MSRNINREETMRIAAETMRLKRRQVEFRDMSIFTWFPLFQIFLLIPLITFIFKRKSAWFNFAPMATLVLVFPGTLMVIFVTML